MTLIAQLCQFYGVAGWRQHAYHLRQLKKLFRKTQKLKSSTSHNVNQKEKRQGAIQQAHQAYLDLSTSFLQHIQLTLDFLCQNYPVNEIDLLEINRFMVHAQRQVEQIRRRVLQGETIPHGEKVFSLFEEHTEWISKGKAGVPQELGLKVCVLEDQFGFILHHQVMQQLTDDQVTVPMVEATQQKFPTLESCSFDKGFHSPENQKQLKNLLKLVGLPKKGKLSQDDQLRERQPDFVQSRQQHSAVESAINALENHGLDRCPDQGLPGFKRYVALAVLGRNLQILGDLIQQQKL
jgi:hypothetical protein